MKETNKKLNGVRYNRLTIIEDLGILRKGNDKSKRHYLKCICECGNVIITRLDSISTGRTKSCGCLHNKSNEYTIIDKVVFVKLSNCSDKMICDLDEWEKFKKYYWHKDIEGYAATNMNTESGTKKFRFHTVVLRCDNGLVRHHKNLNKLDNVNGR